MVRFFLFNVAPRGRFGSRGRAVLGGLFCWVLTSGIAAAADWNQFRGPGGDGLALDARVPLRWGADESAPGDSSPAESSPGDASLADPTPGALWRTPLPGKGWSSPVVSGNAIYLTTAVPIERAEGEAPDQSLRLLRVNLDTGRLEVDVEVFRQDGSKSPRIHEKNSHASPTPIVAGDRVFVHFGHQGTACLDRDGKLIWSNDQLNYDPTHGNGGSPLLVDGLVIFNADAASDPFLAALDASTGNVRWKMARQTDADRTFSFSTPTLIEDDGQPLLISSGSNVVGAHDPSSGREVWRVRYDGYSVIPKPVWGDGMVYVCTGYNTPSLLAIRTAGARGDVTDTHVAWTYRRGVPHTPSLVLRNGLLFMVSDRGVATCLDAASGRSVWTERLRGEFSASPVLAGDRIYFFSEAGAAYVVRAAAEFELLAENHLNERTLASCAIADNSLIVRTANHLYRFSD